MAKKYTEEQILYVEELITRKKKPLKVTPAARKMCRKFDLPYNETVGRYFRNEMQKLQVGIRIQLPLGEVKI